VFYWNTADRGGAIWYGGLGWPRIENCVFDTNDARQGGAVYLINTRYAITFSQCVFINNVATSAGGAIFGYNVPLVADDCVFVRNIAVDDGGGAYLSKCYPSSMSRCTFFFSRALSGGGVSLAGSTSLTVDRSIIAASDRGGAVALAATATLTFSCSDLHGNIGGDWTGAIAGQLGLSGNFSADPLFCDAAAYDLTLQASSPCTPGHHPDGSDCGLIGAKEVGCGGVAVRERSWGAIKSMFAD
jgi:predicted outer membrane repeat protein